MRKASWLVIAALVIGACSSTGMHEQDVPFAGETAGPGVSEPATTGAPTDVPATSAPGGASAPTPAGGTARTPGSPGTGSVDFAPPGRGVTDDEIKIGFWYIDTDAVCSAAGAMQQGPCGTDNDRAEIDAINEWINAHDGIAGRTLVPIVFETNSSNATFSAQEQAACTAFTEDEEVFAVVAPPQVGRPGFARCLTEHDTPVIEAGFWPFDTVAYRELDGYLYQPNRPRPERWMRAYMDGLAAQDFFGQGSVVGLVRMEGAVFKRITDTVIERRLARHGTKLEEEAVISVPDDNSGYGQANAQMNNAVLRFRNAGVNRVIFFATLGEIQFFWFQQAEAQGFRPRYGLSTMDWPEFMAEIAPAAQLQGTLGVGWGPRYDVAPPQDPGGSAAAKRCKKILADAGLQVETGRNAKCDSAFFLKRVLDGAPAINLRGLRAAVEGIGTSFRPAETFAMRFGPGRYDGPSHLRYFAFDEGCGCFEYTTGLKRMR